MFTCIPQEQMDTGKRECLGNNLTERPPVLFSTMDSSTPHAHRLQKNITLEVLVVHQKSVVQHLRMTVEFINKEINDQKD